MGVALVARIVTSLFRITYGIVPVPFVGPSPWTDYNLYVSDLHFVASGYVPYRDFGFWYTPLFLYFLLPLYYLFGTFGPSLFIVLSDALTAGIIFLIVARRHETRLAMVVGLAYALLPFALYNEGYLWLSSQPMTFFALLSVYMLLKDKPYWSVAALAISVLFKQEVIILLPLLIFWQFKRNPKKALKGVVLFLTIIAVVSTPFLILDANNYLFETSYGLIKTGLSVPFIVSAYPSGGTSPIYPLLACMSTIVAGKFTGNVCSAGNLLSMNWIYTQPFAYRVVSSFTSMLVFLIPVLFGLLCVSLYAVRRADGVLQLAFASSIVGLLSLFESTVSAALAYYFIPVYALILSASTGKKSLAVAITGSLIPALIPDGLFQTLFAIGVLFALVVAKDREILNGRARVEIGEPRTPSYVEVKRADHRQAKSGFESDAL